MYSAKTDTTTPDKLGSAVGFSTRASRAGVGFYTTLQVCVLQLVWAGFYTTVGFYISLLYLFKHCRNPNKKFGLNFSNELRLKESWSYTIKLDIFMS